MDDRERTVDLHALRDTFGTHLSKVGVPPRVATAAMRHSDIRLTMNIYSNPVLLGVGAAVDTLPAFEAVQSNALTVSKNPRRHMPSIKPTHRLLRGAIRVVPDLLMAFATEQFAILH